MEDPLKALHGSTRILRTLNGLKGSHDFDLGVQNVGGYDLNGVDVHQTHGSNRVSFIGIILARKYTSNCAQETERRSAQSGDCKLQAS